VTAALSCSPTIATHMCVCVRACVCVRVCGVVKEEKDDTSTSKKTQREISHLEVTSIHTNHECLPRGVPFSIVSPEMRNAVGNNSRGVTKQVKRVCGLLQVVINFVMYHYYIRTHVQLY
jgi:hypothetical protein